MANSKITQLTALTTPIRTDIIPIVDDPGGTPVTKKMELTYLPGWIYPNDSRWVGTAGAPLTSTSFDGDSFSDTAATLIDLSAAFGVPAGVKAVYLYVLARDSASATVESSVGFAQDTANVITKRIGTENDIYDTFTPVIPCDANGDIYYIINASGAGTLDLIIRVFGYMT